jgi:DNA topoisomerase-1
MILFGESLPRLRRQVEQDFQHPGLPREKVLATVIQILDRTGARVGNEEYVRANNHFGITTLRNRHADVCGSRLRLEFVGKGGKRRTIELADRRVAKIIGRCQSLPGQELFQYLDESGGRHKLRSEDVNEYLRAAAGEEFTAKDFRTWTATLLAARLLVNKKSEANRGRALLEVIDEVARTLGNTRAICRSCYIHPAVMTGWSRGALDHVPAARARRHLSGEELQLLALLRSAKPERRVA